MRKRVCGVQSKEGSVLTMQIWDRASVDVMVQMPEYD